MIVSKSKIFLWSCVIVVIGLAVGENINLNVLYWPAMIVIALGSVWWNKFWQIVMLMLAVIVGSLWYAQVKQPPDLSKYFKEKQEVVFDVAQDPTVTAKSQRFPASLIEVAGERYNSAIIMVTMPRYPEYFYGQRLNTAAELAPVSEFNTKYNAAAETVFPKVHDVSDGYTNWFKSWLYQVKAKMLTIIGLMLPEPHAGLMGGLLLGTRNFSQELSEQFRITGTAHIVAISGFNVTIVAGIMESLFKRFGRNIASIGSALGIIGLVIITGAQASVVRAGIMGGLMLLAKRSGRVYASVNALMVTAVVMLAQNPRLLIFDVGFQLSFAALAGLLFVQPQLDARWPNFPLKDFLYPTIAAQITTTPLLLYHFGNFSFISILTNLLVLPVIPWAMLVGFVAVVSAWIMPILGQWLGAAAWCVLEYIITVIQICAQLPWASVSEIKFPLILAIGYYLILAGLINQKWKHKLLEYLK